MVMPLIVVYMFYFPYACTLDIPFYSTELSLVAKEVVYRPHNASAR